MSLFRLIAAFALAVGLTAAAPAFAGDQGLYSGAPRGMPLDPQLLPANTGPGDCVTRRMTGPGDAYRWDRVECDNGQGYAERGWSDHDQWGYGRQTQVQVVEARGAPPASYACDRCSAPVPAPVPAPGYCDPCNAAASATYYDQPVADSSRTQVQGYQSGARWAPPASYACDRCSAAVPVPAPAPSYCDPCSAAGSAAYYDQRAADSSRTQVQGYQSGYQSGYQAHFQGGYDTVCIQGCAPQGYAQQNYAQSYAYARGYAGVEGDRYGPAPTYGYDTDYAVSGRDEAGYLVWPGKRP